MDGFFHNYILGAVLSRWRAAKAAPKATTAEASITINRPDRAFSSVKMAPANAATMEAPATVIALARPAALPV